MKPKQIAIFTHGIKRGPFARLGTTLARGFQESGINCDLVILQTTETQRAKYPDVRVVSLGVKRAALSLFPLVKYLRQRQPEIVFTMPSYFNVLAIWARYLSGVNTKIIMGEHNICSLETKIEHGEKLKIRYLPLLMRYVYPSGDGLIGVCEDTLKDLATQMRVAPNIPTKVISNPIDVKQIQQLSNQPIDHPWFQKRDRPIVLTVARMAKQKQLDLLLHAFAEVKAKIPARLIILGDGLLREQLTNLCQQLGIREAVWMPGYKHNPYKYMAACDLFVLYSAWEGCPIALEEALACGAAIVVNDALGGSKDLVGGGKYGAIAPNNNLEALADKMLEILRNSQLKKHYQQQALIRSQDFQYQNITQQYLNFALFGN